MKKDNKEWVLIAKYKHALDGPPPGVNDVHFEIYCKLSPVVVSYSSRKSAENAKEKNEKLKRGDKRLHFLNGDDWDFEVTSKEEFIKVKNKSIFHNHCS